MKRRHPSAGTAPDDLPLVVIGPLDGQVAGNTVATRVVLEHLRRAGPVHAWTTLDRHNGALRGHVARVVLFAGILARLAARGVRGRHGALVALNNRGGLLFDLVLVACLRLMRWRVALHHHCVNYLHRPHALMRWICRVAGAETTHLVASRVLADDLRRMYPEARRTLVLPLALEPARPASESRALRPDGAITVGFLSNLVAAKGVDTFLEIAGACRARGVQVDFVMAGRPVDAALVARVRACEREHAGRLRYVGAVVGADKEAFFAGLDVLVFPSQEESWGIVVSEAMCRGVPVIALRNRYVTVQFTEDNRCEFEPGAPGTVEAIVALLARLAATPDTLGPWRETSRVNYARLRAGFEGGVARLGAWLRRGDAAGIAAPAGATARRARAEGVAP